MKLAFAILAALFFAGGLFEYSEAKTATHEIAGLIMLVMGLFFVMGAGIIRAINQVRDRLPR